MHNLELPARGISRRRVVAGMAWSVPVVAVMSATPAFAASVQPPASVRLDWDNLRIWQASGRRITGNVGIKLIYPVLTATASVVLQLYRASDNALVETTTFGG